MAKHTLQNSISDHSWRMITQSGLKDVSVHAKKRHFSLRLKTCLLFLSCLALLLFLVLGIFCYQKQVFLNTFMPAVKYLEIQSDGVLTDRLLIPFIGLPKDIGIMKVDIFALQGRLKSLAQVREAIVERQFPDTIKVTINEYLPVVKVVAVDEFGKKQGLLVSKEGHVFRAYGYSSKKLKPIPYLTGIQLYKSGSSFKNVPFMDCLDEFLRCAQLESPGLYKYWKSVSLAHYQNGNYHLGSFIKVKTRNLGEIIFAPEKFGLQLGRLNSIVAYASKQKLATIERIDLSMGSQAAVKVISN